MAHSEKISQLARVGLIAMPLLMGVALLATTWSSHRGVTDASDTLARGQVDFLHRSFRARVVELGGPPSAGDLEAFLSEHAPDGLRYVASLDERGAPQARAGDPLGPPGIDPASPPRPGELVAVGDRLRLAFWRGGARDRNRLSDPGRFRGVPFVLELQPTVAEELRAASTRTLATGAAAAGTLLLLAFGLMRWYVRRQQEEQVRERDRRLAGLGRMSAVLAHEIRNPLASLKGNAQLLARSLSDDERHRAKAERVVSEAVRLENLTNDLLEFARAGVLQRTAVDPTGLLRDAAGSVDAGRIQIVPEGAPASWPLDRERMRQVLTNLLENAIQAGGGQVQARVTGEPGRLIYEVRDRGDGIPEGELDRIFEPFHTLRTHGTGLGLAVAKRLVELHGGTISATNLAGGGALFRVTLPEP